MSLFGFFNQFTSYQTPKLRVGTAPAISHPPGRHLLNLLSNSSSNAGTLIPSIRSLAVAHRTYFAGAEMLNSSFHCAQQRKAIAAFGPARGRGGHAFACWDLINPNRKLPEKSGGVCSCLSCHCWQSEKREKQPECPTCCPVQQGTEIPLSQTMHFI